MKTTSLPISLWAKTQSFLFPTRSSLVKEPEAVASAAAFPSAAKRELTPPGPACQQLFFSNPEVFFGARREDFSPAQKRELIPTPSRCQPLSSAFFKKPLPCCPVTTQQLQVVFNTQPKHLHTLPQTPLSVNHFLNFFPNVFFSISNLFVLLHYENCVFRDDTHEKSPERGLPGPSHQFA